MAGSSRSATVHEAALDALAAADIIVWDGDWLKDDAFTSVVPAFLQAKPSRRAVAFRKATPTGHAFFEAWDVPSLTGRLGLVQVPQSELERSMRELSGLGTPEADLTSTALGWVTMHSSGCTSILAIGGGAATTALASACAATRRRAGDTSPLRPHPTDGTH